jgi:tetratricopeptide (TPR) repeat protein
VPADIKGSSKGIWESGKDSDMAMISVNDAHIKTRTVFIFLLLTGLVVYVNSFNVPFHFDDIYSLKENLGIKTSPLVWGMLTDNPARFFTGRPLLLFSFLVNYKLGGLDTFGYHLFNLLLHVVNAFLLYVILNRFADQDRRESYSFSAALASLIFLIHPINTESVTYLSGRSSALSSLFVLVALLCFFRATGKRFHAGYYVLSVLAFLFGLLTKEAAIVLPALLLFADYFFASDTGKGLGARLKYHIPFLAITALLSGVYLHYLTRPLLQTERLWLTHLLTELKVFMEYGRLLVVPAGLSIDHDIRPSNSFDTSVVVSATLIAALLFFAALLRSNKPRLSFSIFWFFTALAPFLIIRLNDFMAERWAYLASIGFSIGLAEILMTAMDKRRKAGIASIAVVVVLLGGSTVLRNHVFASPVRLWEDTVAKAPEKYRPYLNLSRAYTENGEPNKAIQSALEGIRRMKERGLKGRDLTVAHLNLSAAYGTDYAKAEEALKAVEREGLYDYEYHRNLGALAMKRGQYEKAISSFKRALELSPGSPSFLAAIGQCYERCDKPQAAREWFVRATHAVPQNAQEFMAQGLAFSRLGDNENAFQRFIEAVRTDPLDVNMRIFVGNIMLNAGQPDQAFRQYSAAASLSPNFAPAYIGMGVVLQAKGNLSGARNHYQKALNILSPDAPEREQVRKLLNEVSG